MRFVGIDYGLVRTGLAVSDPDGQIAFPLATLNLKHYANRKIFLASLTETIVQAGAEAVVMGLPLLENNQDSLTTRQIRNITAKLKHRLPLPFFYMNELLSSAEAWEDLCASGCKKSKRRAVLDQQAAVRILTSFLHLPEHARLPA